MRFLMETLDNTKVKQMKTYLDQMGGFTSVPVGFLSSIR